MKYQVKEKIQIREEDGFYLVVNLTTQDMLDGYPAFFKVNKLGRFILEIIKTPTEMNDITDFVYRSFSHMERELISRHVTSFINSMRKYSLVEEVD